MKKRNLFWIMLIILPMLLNQSCVNTKKATYFYNIGDTLMASKYPIPRPIIQPNDILSIIVSSMNPEASATYNLPDTHPANPEEQPGYLVNQKGYIQFPVLGKIKAEGLTREELQEKIANELVNRKLLLDPIVSIKQTNFKVTVLGEVKDPGVIPVKNEKISLLEAIGKAGDLTIYAERNNVLLVRIKPNGDKLTRRLNLNSSKIFDSPYFYLKNNDVIYVEPNKAKVASSGRSNVILPILFSGMSLVIITLRYLIDTK